MFKRKGTLLIALSVCLLIVLFSIRAEAQSLPSIFEHSPNAPTGDGTYLTYQGQLADKDGQPVETAVEMVFKLYNADGGVVYTSATRTITPTQGMFTVHIGAPPDPPLERWMLDSITEIGVTVDDDPEMSPRQSFNSVLGSSESGVGVAGNSSSGVGVYGVSQSYYGVHGVSQSGSAVHGHSNNGVGVSGWTSSTNPGIKGDNSSIGPGVFGWSARGTGVTGHTNSTDPTSAGVFGGNNGGLGFGVSGWSSEGTGVFGNSSTGIGVSGYTSSTGVAQAGVRGGNSGSGSGVYGGSQRGDGVHGWSAEGTGVAGFGPVNGVYGHSDAGTGVNGNSQTGVGVSGYTSSTTTENAAVFGNNSGVGPGVKGIATHGFGVYGRSTDDAGVIGYTESRNPYSAAIFGGNNGGLGYGVNGWSSAGTGVFGNSSTGIGVSGYTSSTQLSNAGVYGSNGGSGAGVYGWSPSGSGVYGNSMDGYGVNAYSPHFIGVNGYSDTGLGMWTASRSGIGIYAQTITGTAAGYFTATNPTQATAVVVNAGASSVLQLQNGGANGDGSGGGDFIEAVSSDGGDVQFRVTTSGTVKADGPYDSSGADFAEMLPAGSDVEPGDVLVIGLDGTLRPSTEPYQLTVVGVHSTRPGFVGGNAIDGSNAGKIPLAIMGVVPSRSPPKMARSAPVTC